MKFYYLDKELAKKNICCLVAFSDEKIVDYRSRFNDSAVEFVGEELPHYISYVDGKVREATQGELVSRGEVSLLEGQYLDKDGKVNIVEQTEEFISPKWDATNRIWVEGANVTQTYDHMCQLIKFNLRETNVFETETYTSILEEDVINLAKEYRANLLRTLIELQGSKVIKSTFSARKINIPNKLLAYI